MWIYCEATIEDERQRENLCECVNIIGDAPRLAGMTVRVRYENDTPSVFLGHASKLATLFENYANHGIVLHF